MRCSKCGFISFDHLLSCAKCGKDISEVATELQGTSIKVDPPMFLSGALAAFSESEESFEEQAMDAEVDEGIDFDMGMDADEEEPIEMADSGEDVDFSIEEEEVAQGAEEIEVAEEADISFAEPEPEEAVDVEMEAEEEAVEVEVSDESFEELDFLGTPDEEEGGLEFDLEDFMEEMDDEKPKTASSEDGTDVDLDLGEEET
ncbi:hypothetical protein ACFLZ5_01540 [Thermodesulfobacteriota bacterium]